MAGLTFSPGSPIRMPPKFDRAIVVKNVLLLTLGTLVAQALMALSMLLTARQLGSMRFGEYAASFSATGLMSVLFNLGLDTWLLQRGSCDPEKLGALTGSAFTFKALMGIPWILGVVWFLPHLNSQTFTAQLVLISALSVWVESFFATGLSVFRTLLLNHLTALLLVLARGGVLLATITLILLDVKNSMIYALVRLVVAILAVLVSLLFIPIKPKIHSLNMLKIAAQESAPFALSDIFAFIYLQADTTIAAIFLGKEEVGLYAPASSFINALFVIPNAWFFVAVPILVRMLKDNERPFHRILSLTGAGFAAIGVALWLSVRYASSVLPAVLGESFERSGYLLTILSPILLLKSCNFAAAAILVSVGWQNLRVYAQAVSAIANVVLNLVIIRRLGITGVAMAYVISEAILLIGYVGLVIKWMRGRCPLVA
ncbi:MAG: oligosaccharide flippase family protein [Candidatus Methanomethyliaceae archaeon]